MDKNLKKALFEKSVEFCHTERSEVSRNLKRDFSLSLKMTIRAFFALIMYCNPPGSFEAKAQNDNGF